MGGSREAPPKCCFQWAQGQPTAPRESRLGILGPTLCRPLQAALGFMAPGFITALVVTACVMSGNPVLHSELLQTPL